MTISANGSFTASGAANTSVTLFRYGRTDARGGRVRLTNTGSGTVQLERKGPGDSAWAPIFVAGQQLYVWNYTGSALDEAFSEAVDGASYRLNCTAFTSGEIDWEIEA